LHIPWRAIPEWKLNAETLSKLRLLILPESSVFDPADLPVLETWLRNGGHLIITGNSGMRLGEAANFDQATTNTLAVFGSSAQDGLPNIRTIGKGSVCWLREDPGMPYYEAADKRIGMLEQFAKIISEITPGQDAWSMTAPTVPSTVGLTLYQSPGRIFIDINNTDIDLKTDALKPTPALHLSVNLPPELRGKKLAVRVLSPDLSPQIELSPIQEGRVEVRVDPVIVYSSIIIEPARK
jgi:hypothetical protein